MPDPMERSPDESICILTRHIKQASYAPSSHPLSSHHLILSHLPTSSSIYPPNTSHQTPNMQLTTIIALLATSLVVSATPVELEEKRQLEGAARVYARFYRDGGCGPSPWAEDTVFLQSDTVGLAGCQDLTVGPFPSTLFDINNFSRTGT